MHAQSAGPKREIPGAMQKILKADVYLTDKFCNWANCFLPLRSLRIHYKALEISCHGIPWLAGWIIFIWLADSRSLYQMQFSFPSGHASRAVFVSLFFILIYPIHFIFYMPLIAWATSICISRVLLRRHHLLDVFGGVALGIFEAILINWLWVSEGFSFWIISWISDEKLDGGSYHRKTGKTNKYITNINTKNIQDAETRELVH
ncbi:hypothetical protein C0J52_23588 [Blattella germanica]|nr:hypothetical protein C0J52_23588 [Blattella germanica]